MAKFIPTPRPWSSTWKVVAERAACAYAETLEATTSIQVFGEPSNAVLEMVRRQAGAGVLMMVKRFHIGGPNRIQQSGDGGPGSS